MTTVQRSKGSAGHGGFHRWVKLSTDDLPLIRPPRHHMLAHMTGGLVHLYDAVKLTKKEGAEEFMTPYHEGEQCKEDCRIDAEKAEEAKNGHVNNGECENGQEGEKNVEKEENKVGKEEQEEDKKEKVKEKVEEEEEKKEDEEAMGEENMEEGSKEEASTTDAPEDKPEKQESADEENNEDKKEENSQNEKKDDEGGGKDKAKSEADEEEEEEEEEEGKETLSKAEQCVLDGDELGKDATLKSEDDDDDDDDDDGDDDDVDMEDEETTPYTDEEGEFSPEKDMPLLAERFKYTQVLARGQSAIIIKVLDTFHKNRPLAIKVLHRVYKPIGSQEADILLELHRADPWLHVPFARLLNQFLYGPHYCLVFEYLSPTPLYTHYDQRDIREASALPHIRDLTVKLLTVLGFLYKQNVIHADLKPENILLKSEDDLSSLMVVDFGNALRNTDEELSLYYSDFELQTLLYRAPEVIFGMKFSLEVDMWSLGCLLAECYLGEPLFMGKSKKEILSKITELMGPFPREFNDGEYAEEFAEFIGRPMSRYQRLENLRKRLNDCKDSMFLMLVERLLTYLPDRRFTPFEAACHPFVACSTPFLYLTPSPGYIRYPTVLLDMSTYPYLPGLPDDDDEDSASAHGRKRLALFSRHKRPQSSNTGGLSLKQGQCANHKDRDGKDASGAGGKTATRSDVKETLKSMGLRCEDFTISVYSREQAHAILKRQGVEVTPNNLQGRDKVALLTNKGLKNVKSNELPKYSYMRTGNTRSVGQDDEEEEDDDDDCVILDPPDVPKPVPKLPQQFQLMGTTVQVNRGAKRPNRPLTNQPQAKRCNARPMMYYRNDHEQDIGPEASVQDTLKRLKNYNISITCRRNASGMRPQGGMMDSESDMENDSHMDSDDDGEDMTKYLECQIGEIEEVQDEVFDEDFDVDCDDKNDADYNPRGKKRRQNKKSPRKGKRLSSTGADNKGNEDSCTSDITALVPNVEMAELSDHQASSNHSGEPEQDPLAEENEDAKELRDILENATHLQEDEEQENNHNTNHENERKEADENHGTVNADDTNVEKDDDGKEETLGELIEAAVDESAANDVNTAEDEEEEEIDEELEKELLSGNLEDGEEGEEMEDL